MLKNIVRVIEEQERIKEQMFSLLREKFPGVRFELTHFELHGPLEVCDSGYSANFKGNDGNNYDAYIWVKHPGNYLKKKLAPWVSMQDRSYYFK